MPEQPSVISEPGLKLVVREDMQLLYSNHIAVHGTETEIIVSFLQAAPPVEFTGTGTHSGAVSAVCVARVALAPKLAAGLVQILTQALEKHRSAFPAKAEA